MPCTRRDLIPQPLCYKVCALPLCYNNQCPAQVSNKLIYPVFPNLVTHLQIESSSVTFRQEKNWEVLNMRFFVPQIFLELLFQGKDWKKFSQRLRCWCRNFLLNVKIPRFALWGFSISFFCANCRTCYIFINQTRNNPSASPREGSKDDKSVAKAPFKQPLVYGG